MDNDIFRTNIFTTYLRQYLFTGGALRVVVVLLTTLVAHYK